MSESKEKSASVIGGYLDRHGGIVIEQRVCESKMAIFVAPEEVPAVCEMLWSHYLESLERFGGGKGVPVKPHKKSRGFCVKMTVQHLNYFLHYPQRIARAVRFANAIGVRWHVGVPHADRDVRLRFSLRS